MGIVAGPSVRRKGRPFQTFDREDGPGGVIALNRGLNPAGENSATIRNRQRRRGSVLPQRLWFTTTGQEARLEFHAMSSKVKAAAKTPAKIPAKIPAKTTTPPAKAAAKAMARPLVKTMAKAAVKDKKE
jgi:hypothetical protein